MIDKVAVFLGMCTLLVAGCELRSRPFPQVFGNDGNGCRHEGSTYSHGSNACRAGVQYRCEDGRWQGRGDACLENLPVADRGCELNGHSHPSGSTSCLSGTQYRCDDGNWRNLRMDCIADAPTRRGPGRHACMYNGEPVTAESTICNSGVIFVCRNGEWRNLGRACH